ncbi:hypothetical protein DFP73DRAFT_523123 [Morchella snyderi]|nr:hypothetical protein DFP73DRAFT_523123 [Morchella snyderi]
MAPYHAPPTKVLSSKPLSSSQAHAFLSTFTLAANGGGAGQNEIVLTNLKRIEQALLGIYVPRPVKEDMILEEGMTDMAAPIADEEAPVEGVGEEYVEGEENGEDEMYALEDREEGQRNTMIPEVSAAKKPKVDKKADKKARRKEEKKARAEQRKKERQDEDEDEDEDEE